MTRKQLRRVLLVEDDRDIQVVASLALSEIGRMVVEVSSSAEEALAVASSFQPDLILLDVMMPGIDGIGTLEALRKDPNLAKIPVVFMTARAQSHEIEQYRKLGSLGVISKPFEPEKLAETLRALWDRHVD